MTLSPVRAAAGHMASWWIRTEGRAMQLEQRETPVPAAGPGEVRVRIHAASLNRGEFVAGLGLHAGRVRRARPASRQPAKSTRSAPASATCASATA
jgi:NADPH2:quinone reductase